MNGPLEPPAPLCNEFPFAGDVELLGWSLREWSLSTAKQGDNALGTVRLRPLSQLNRLTYDLDFWYVGRPWPWLGWVVGRRSRSSAKNRVLHHCYIALGSRSVSRSKVRVKDMGQGQISGAQRSILGARLCRMQQRATTTITSLRWLSKMIYGRGDGIPKIACTQNVHPSAIVNYVPPLRTCSLTEPVHSHLAPLSNYTYLCVSRHMMTIHQLTYAKYLMKTESP